MYENSPPNPSQQRIVIGALILGLAFVDLFMIPVLDFGGGPESIVSATIFGSVLGIVIAQVNLISIWAALAAGPLVMRLPWSLLLTVCMFYAIVAGGYLSEWSSLDLQEAATLGFILLGAQIIAQFPLWLGSRVFGWRLLSAAQAAEPENSQGQFSIKQLFIGMSLLAITFALGRAVLPSGTMRIDQLLPRGETWVLLGSIVVCNLVIVIPCIWGAFLPRERIKKLAWVWAALVAGVTVGQLIVLSGLLGGPPDTLEVLWVMFMINLFQVLTVVGVLLVLRGHGFRLVRDQPGAGTVNES